MQWSSFVASVIRMAVEGSVYCLSAQCACTASVNSDAVLFSVLWPSWCKTDCFYQRFACRHCQNTPQLILSELLRSPTSSVSSLSPHLVRHSTANRIDIITQQHTASAVVKHSRPAWHLAPLRSVRLQPLMFAAEGRGFV